MSSSIPTSLLTAVEIGPMGSAPHIGEIKPIRNFVNIPFPSPVFLLSLTATRSSATTEKQRVSYAAYPVGISHRVDRSAVSVCEFSCVSIVRWWQHILVHRRCSCETVK